MERPGARPAGLEDRLRGLILSNNGNDNGSLPFSSPAKTSIDIPSGVARDSLLDSDVQPLPGPPEVAAAKQPKTGRKRLNQAQRRELSAQLSIPIDPRPLASSNQWGSPLSSAAHRYNAQPYQHSQRFQSGTLNQFDSNHHGSPPSHRYMNHRQNLPSNGPPGFEDQWRPQHGGNSDGMLRNRHQQYPRPQFEASSGHRGLHTGGHGRHPPLTQETLDSQAALLNGLCETIIKDAEISFEEIARNEEFRLRIEYICRKTIAQHELQYDPNFIPETVQLRCFGSLSSGFATKASDMDLGLLSPLSCPQPDDGSSPVPRLLEKAFLEAGLGARLLTRTRVPIIKLCEKPSEQLYKALCQARVKWERGEPEDHGASGDEAAEDEDEDTSPVVIESQESAAVASPAAEVALGNPELALVPGSGLYEDELAKLRQIGTTSLGNYFNSAKKLLRKFGKRDINSTNASELSDDDLQVVTDVAYAFVHGLADEELKTRLNSRYSVFAGTEAEHTHYRGLSGMMAQIEGELLAMAWDKRSLPEKDPRLESEATNKIKYWGVLQDQRSFGTDPLGFSKELKLMRSMLQNIPSLQIQTLKQLQSESALEYHQRTVKLCMELGVYDVTNQDNLRLPIAIRQYALGIWDHKIRDQVLTCIDSMGSSSLKAVARLHKSLQLAADFEKALSKGLYPNDIELIKTYIGILQRPLQRSNPPHHYYDFVVPLTPQDMATVQAVKSLSDPSAAVRKAPRDPFGNGLEFPKSGVGVQCDINFSAHLALQNTLLLRCYSYVDPRVRPMVLFVKHWAKARGINTPYRGTLSSYGYVLMVLHYLVNVAQPFVCPNLQQLARPPNPHMTPAEMEATQFCKGKDVRFWRDEEEIKGLASQNLLTQNRDSVGHLLRGFFEYYAHPGALSIGQGHGFEWGREVLSLRTPGGLLTKQEKGWTGAKTVIVRQPSTPASAPATLFEPSGQLATSPRSTGPLRQAASTETKEVRNRYLFAIEDPFETDHNVARTVTHNGIVGIRDEFRRAWRIIRGVSKATSPSENLLQHIETDRDNEVTSHLSELVDEIHGVGRKGIS